MKKALFSLIFYLVLPVGLPLAGLLAAGRDICRYGEFPPLTRYVAHAPFSLPLFAALAGLGLLTALLFLLQMRRPQLAAAGLPPPGRHPFPWWGRLGLLLLLAGWVLAWNRFAWFARWQPHTFLPLWLGYILVVNGLTQARTGSSLLARRPGFLLTLFPLSAVFWWYFEYLNRFVQNWYYVGVEDFSPLAYVLHASLSFATVLPAVLSTEELLATFTRLTAPLAASWPVRGPGGRLPAILLLLASAAGLAGIGLLPDYLFPLLWLSPLMTITAGQMLAGRPTVFAALGRGDWRPVWLPALAALCCGFFWEMWNFNSQAHWVYSIPFVQRFHLFEMPILGYLGYLPFGLECRLVAKLIDSGQPEKLE
jgi:hypothetical protein